MGAIQSSMRNHLLCFCINPNPSLQAQEGKIILAGPFGDPVVEGGFLIWKDTSTQVSSGQICFMRLHAHLQSSGWTEQEW